MIGGSLVLYRSYSHWRRPVQSKLVSHLMMANIIRRTGEGTRSLKSTHTALAVWVLPSLTIPQSNEHFDPPLLELKLFTAPSLLYLCNKVAGRHL